MHERDEREFAEFYSAAWPRLFRTTYALTGDVAQAEDALQSAFAKAYAGWHRVRSAHRPEAYVRRMAVNEVLGVRRRLWWQRERNELTVDPPAPRSLEQELVDREQLWQALMALAPRQRAVLVLRYYDDLSEAQIADALGVTPGTVKSQASAALVNLRHHYATAITPVGTEEKRS